MALRTRCLALALYISSATSVVLWRPKGCTKVHKDWVSSRPGVPCLEGVAAVYPYTTETAWRGELGERILAAVTPRVTEADCGGVIAFGDSTWCNKAMRGKDMIGLSYGIEQRDMWSEKMAFNWKVPTRLFDCFQDPKTSPPMLGTAPNATTCDGNGAPCYSAPYRAFRTCLGSKKRTYEGRAFDTLGAELTGRAPLSVHLKVDVEGSEWAVLEELLDNEEDMAKIRTLDMEVHFGFNPGSEERYQHVSEQWLLNRQTEILEKLSQKFTVVGSTLEQVHQSWQPQKWCPKSSCNEPGVHLKAGLAMTQLAISWVNPAILSPAPL